nr:MAG TPA: hypothetical protein [Caudoviricetes sp.]
MLILLYNIFYFYMRIYILYYIISNNITVNKMQYDIFL